MDENYILIDSISSILSEEQESVFTVRDADVFINEMYCPFEEKENNFYNGLYRIENEIKEKDICSLRIVYRRDTIYSYTRIPETSRIIGIKDSQIVHYSDSTVLFWNKSNTSFYKLSFTGMEDSLSMNYYRMYFIDDTFCFFQLFKVFLPNTILVDINVFSIDTNYAQNLLFDNSSFENNYGIFGSYSKSVTKGVLLIRETLRD